MSPLQALKQVDAALAQGDLADTLVVLTRLARQAAVDGEAGMLQLACAMRLSRILWLLGDTRGALEQKEAAFQLSLRHGEPLERGLAAGKLAETLLIAGRPTQARRPIAMQVRSLRFCPDSVALTAARKRIRGWELLAEDDAEQALDYAEQALELDPGDIADRASALELQQRCLLELGRLEEALAVSAQAVGLTRNAPGVYLLRRALLTRGELLAEVGDSRGLLLVMAEAISPELEARPGGPLATLKLVLEAAPIELEPEPEDKALRVLLAEDNPINQRIIARQLQTLGMEVLLASDGLEALERAQELQPDLVLMDLQMPGMDGDRVAVALRSRGFTRPILALTASDYQADRRRCLQAGMDLVLTKPLEVAQLEDWLEARGLRVAG
ncbi:MAG: response regulator [Myxococcota bacterium]|nr:response regulator [Myxococcota bacterium]